MFLTDIGWSPEFAELFLAVAGADPAVVPGRVARVDRSAYDVIVSTGDARAALSLPLQREARDDPFAAPTIGDWVVVCTEPPAVIRAVLPRRTTVQRGAGKRTTGAQLLAANIDVLLLVTAASPRAPLNRVERFLTLAWESGARPVVVLTKCDLADDVPQQLRRLTAAAPGADVVTVSAVDGTGVDELASLVGPGVTAAMLGASGAGKSTLANALLNGNELATSQLRADGKGRHTTAWRELVVLPSGGVLLDTPGLRGVQLWDAPDALARTFADVEELAVDCKFGDCSHAGEPDCAVEAAVEAGLLDPRRVASYAKLQREQAALVARIDARARIERRRQFKQIAKSQRSAAKRRG